MPELAAVTAFGRSEARRRRCGPMVLAEDTEAGLASVAARRGSVAPEIGGIRLPRPGTWVEQGAVAAFWVGPDQWMVEVKDGASRDMETALKAGAPGVAVTEQTDGWVILEVESEDGSRPIDHLLERMVNLDPARLGPGCATRTGIEHMSVFVIRRSPTKIAVLGMRSMADSLWHAIETRMSRLTGTGP